MVILHGFFYPLMLIGIGLIGRIAAADLLGNNTFDNTAVPWSVYTATSDLANGELLDGTLLLHINAAGENRWDIQFRRQGLTLEQHHSYTVKFTVTATKPTLVYVKIGQAGAPYNEFWNNDWTPFSLEANTPLSVERTFTMNDPTDGGCELGFHLGKGVTGEVPFDIAFDDIYLDDPEYIPPAGELLGNNTFTTGSPSPWSMYTASQELASGEVVSNEYVVHVGNPGVNRWDIQFRHQGLTIEQGHTYTIRFKLRADKATQVYAKIGQSGSPYNEFWNNGWTPFSLVANETLLVEQTFTMTEPTDGGCELAFHLGNDLAGEVPFDLFFDDMYLQDPEYNNGNGNELAKPDIRINQTGYFPKGKKLATILCESTQPVQWSIRNRSGEVCLSGTTTVFGYDSASGDFVHTADFSPCTTSGQGYVVVIKKNDEEITSHPFDIVRNLYHELKYQTLSYFYHNRSGIAIEMPYAISPEYERPAGHLPDTMRTWPGTGQADYVLDVSKGWYDAGDHGKYVVNGGISVWTILNQYERSLYTRGGSWRSFGDGKLSIPENGNRVPDILDEVRWEMEMLLSMQVPRGKPLAGMVHHKGHDEAWTGIPTRPDLDPMTRYLAPVSTTATLNLAAVAAQCARVWRYLDWRFSNRCLYAALAAWHAANENPGVLASDIETGGGLYGDTQIDDEYYWAACELFITTGFPQFKKYLKNSPYFASMPVDLADGGMCGVFDWNHVQGLGTISLAVVPSFIGFHHVMTARRNIIAAADSLSFIAANEGYGIPLRRNSGYLWGSNSFVINNCIVAALAYDFTCNIKYLDVVSGGMDYLMGRNAMDKSYVSGYGERPLLNPHHRFWAHQANSSYPIVPAGVLSGGPNSALEDPYVQAMGLTGSPAQKCYADHIESWSTNEICINWNAPLAWIAAFLDEKFNQ